MDIRLNPSPFFVAIRRWYKDPVQWTMIAGGISTIVPVTLQYIGLLHLSDHDQFVAILALNGILYAAGAILNYTSTHVIGNAKEVEAQTNAVAILPPPSAIPIPEGKMADLPVEAEVHDA